jgi:excisionase family DNA binding protein
MQPLYLTVREFSEVSRVCRAKVYFLLADGHLKGIKLGGKTLIDREHAEAWLKSRPPVDIKYSPAKRAAA